MKKILSIAAVLALAACSAEQTPGTQASAASSGKSFQCGAGVSVIWQENGKEAATATISQIGGGNVTARSVALNRTASPLGELWQNTAEQVEWLANGSGGALTYLENGSAKMLQCFAR